LIDNLVPFGAKGFRVERFFQLIIVQAHMGLLSGRARGPAATLILSSGRKTLTHGQRKIDSPSR